MSNKALVWDLVDEHKTDFCALSDRIWGMPEICYTEYRSVAEHNAMLKKQGFQVTENVAGISTAVMGEAGHGGPIIAFLGEYDALPGLSQEAGVPVICRCRATVRATAAAIICWVRRRCWRRAR